MATGGRIKHIKIQIREGTKEDLDQVAVLWERLARHHERMSNQFELSPDGPEKWSKYLAKKFSEKSTKLIVATEDGEMIGFMLCLLSPNAPIFKEKKLGLISDVYVMEERRRKGIGRQMLKVALRWFDKNKVKTVELNVAAMNIEARRAWAQLGFTAHVIHKRIDLDGPEASVLIAESGTRVVKKIIRKKSRK